MRIDNQDIIRTARQLRDEENAELHVSPGNRHRHFHVPTWLVTIPTVAIIGFVLGLWTQVVEKERIVNKYIPTPEVVKADTKESAPQSEECTSIQCDGINYAILASK